jgi:carbamate kinase
LFDYVSLILEEVSDRRDHPREPGKLGDLGILVDKAVGNERDLLLAGSFLGGLFHAGIRPNQPRSNKVEALQARSGFILLNSPKDRLKLVVALGGNALESPEEDGSYEAQRQNASKASVEVASLVQSGNTVVLTHGNGPQVGNLEVQQEKSIGTIPAMPLHVLGAMTQGQIGYILQQELTNELGRMKVDASVIGVITRTLVSREDSAFKNPTKPVGPFYDKETADQLVREKGFSVAQVKPTGKRIYRRVVPSPDPIRVVEANLVKRLVEDGVMVIAAGGGGIPVVEESDGSLAGVDAVIDKDLAAERLAEAVGADALLIVTNVAGVSVDFGKATERVLRRISSDQARDLMNRGEFLKGSMLPKVEACLRFVGHEGRRAFICKLGQMEECLNGSAGTEIVANL